VLVFQHFETFRRRFAPFPVRVEMLSRFVQPEERKKVLADLAAGKVDIVIGTHRLLSKDIEFRDLGLLIVDEEQRFGVAAKESLKQLRREVDVLTLTATPIPRTLHMTMLGVRDVSTIETPPEERLAIRTYVTPYDPEVVAEAIERERELLQPLKSRADVTVDTTDLNVHQLRSRIVELFGDVSSETDMRVNVVSFGYKHGLPLDVDLVLDCRFLPNPHWVEELRPQTGLDPDVRDYVLAQPDAGPFFDRVDDLLELLLPAYAREGRTYLSIAVGCTGGRHRSVVVAEAIAGLLRGHGYAPAVTHRDVGR